MLAQGEFKKFIESGSEKRSEIFRKIFHTDIYKEFQDKLKTESAEKLEEKKKSANLSSQKPLPLKFPMMTALPKSAKKSTSIPTEQTLR